MNNQRAFPAYGQILQLQFIVTAAVHQGFSSEREPASLTVWHWAGVSSHTLSYDFAETYVFDKQLLGPLHCDLMFQRYPFFRSYGVILPSSLKRVSSRFFVFSTTPPVSVYGTGLQMTTAWTCDAGLTWSDLALASSLSYLGSRTPRVLLGLCGNLWITRVAQNVERCHVSALDDSHFFVHNRQDFLGTGVQFVPCD